LAEQNTKRINRRRTETYRREALALSERIGVTKAAQQTGLAELLIYGWCKEYSALSDEQK